MVLVGLATADWSAAAMAAMTTLRSRLMDLIGGIPTCRPSRPRGRPRRSDRRTSAAQRRSAMATLRVAFPSALVLELIATSA